MTLLEEQLDLAERRFHRESVRLANNDFCSNLPWFHARDRVVRLERLVEIERSLAVAWPELARLAGTP